MAQMKVKGEAARKMLVAYGVESAAECSDKKLQAKLNDLPSITEEVPDDANPTDEDGQLRDEILEALKDGKKIVLDAGSNGHSATGPKKKAVAKKGGGGIKKAGKEGGPGVIASIVEFLQKATAKKPLSKKDLVAKLAARFPDRDAESMAKTVNVQVPSRLKKDKELDVKSNENGYWVEGE